MAYRGIQGVFAYAKSGTVRAKVTGMNTTQYDAETIRVVRPLQIKVQHGRGRKAKSEVAEIRGWSRAFPIVCFGDGWTSEVEVAVETLVHCLNTGTPILL